jgi:hypothetical protein
MKEYKEKYETYKTIFFSFLYIHKAQMNNQYFFISISLLFIRHLYSLSNSKKNEEQKYDSFRPPIHLVLRQAKNSTYRRRERDLRV